MVISNLTEKRVTTIKPRAVRSVTITLTLAVLRTYLLMPVNLISSSKRVKSLLKRTVPSCTLELFGQFRIVTIIFCTLVTDVINF